MTDSTPRHQLFQAARLEAGWTVQQLWIGYIAVGGNRDAFDIEAYLHGVGPLSDDQQDVLATAVNERLYDLYRAARVPYHATWEPKDSCQDPLALIEEMLAADPPDEGTGP